MHTIAVFSSFLAKWDWPDSPSSWYWFVFGLTGNLIFGSRFFIQWLHSEKHKESRIPVVFWWLSVMGTLILLTYFLHKNDLVGMLGNGPQLIPYVRNLMLIYKKKKRDAAHQPAQPVGDVNEIV